MSACAAPWYELNVSAPDNNVSSCCYYRGDKDPWSEGVLDLDAYWNSPKMQRIRALQRGAQRGEPVDGPNGCDGCFFYLNKTPGTYYLTDFTEEPADLSPPQRANWQRARADFTEGRLQATCTPLRIYANFGFTCNLACTMCGQLPVRATTQRFITADQIFAWRETLKAVIDVSVIGGEPFAMPEALAFIRQFVLDDELDPVRLSIFTNGTVHHKHIDMLRRKRKLGFQISIDSIGEAYEEIRVNGKWDLVARNILMLQEINKTERPDWYVQTNAIIQKTGIPFLPAYAKWHAEHGVITSFSDFANTRGIEDTFLANNVIRYPHILEDMPEWEEHFHAALDIFRAANQSWAAESLEHFRRRVAEGWARHEEEAVGRRTIEFRNDWQPALRIGGTGDVLRFLDRAARLDVDVLGVDHERNRAYFSEFVDGDALYSDLFAIDADEAAAAFRIKLRWSYLGKLERRAHIFLRDLQGREMPSTVRTRRDGDALEVTLTGSLKPGRQSLRIAVLPVGEHKSFLPTSMDFDLEGASLLDRAELGGGSRALDPETAIATL